MGARPRDQSLGPDLWCACVRAAHALAERARARRQRRVDGGSHLPSRHGRIQRLEARRGRALRNTRTRFRDSRRADQSGGRMPRLPADAHRSGLPAGNRFAAGRDDPRCRGNGYPARRGRRPGRGSHPPRSLLGVHASAFPQSGAHPHGRHSRAAQSDAAQTAARLMLLCEAPRPTKAHARILLLALAGWTFDFYDLILYTFLVRPISHDLGLNDMDHALALGISFGATAVGGIASGFAADRFGRRTVVMWTILLYSAGSLASGLAVNKAMLLVARAVPGVGAGGEWAAGHALVAETFPAAHRGRAGAILQTGAPIGVGLATLVGTFVVPHTSWRAILIASSATALIAFAARRG